MDTLANLSDGKSRFSNRSARKLKQENEHSPDNCVSSVNGSLSNL